MFIGIVSTAVGKIVRGKSAFENKKRRDNDNLMRKNGFLSAKKC